MSHPDARIEDVPPARHAPPPSGCRDAPRPLLRGAEGVISWEEEQGEITCRATVLIIGGGGGTLLADRAPRVGHSLRLSLPSEPAGAEPIEGHVIEVRPDPSGGRVVHVRFPRWVPLGPFILARGDRRRWVRHPARESRASLNWAEGGTEKAIRGDLLNISVGGAAFLGDALPPAGVSIRLRLEAGARRAVPIGAVEGRLIMSSFDPTGRWIAHIEFVDRCPPDLFELAVNGG